MPVWWHNFANAMARVVHFLQNVLHFLEPVSYTHLVRGQLNVDTYYKSIEECESSVTSCYQAMTYGGWWQINTVWLLSEMCGDDAWMGNTSQ